jgi:hypothetical protein
MDAARDALISRPLTGTLGHQNEDKVVVIAVPRKSRQKAAKAVMAPPGICFLGALFEPDPSSTARTDPDVPLCLSIERGTGFTNSLHSGKE